MQYIKFESTYLCWCRLSRAKSLRSGTAGGQKRCILERCHAFRYPVLSTAWQICKWICDTVHLTNIIAASMIHFTYCTAIKIVLLLIWVAFRHRVECNGFTIGGAHTMRAESRCGSDWSRALYWLVTTAHYALWLSGGNRTVHSPPPSHIGFHMGWKPSADQGLHWKNFRKDDPSSLPLFDSSLNGHTAVCLYAGLAAHTEKTIIDLSACSGAPPPQYFPQFLVWMYYCDIYNMPQTFSKCISVSFIS